MNRKDTQALVDKAMRAAMAELEMINKANEYIRKSVEKNTQPKKEEK